LLPPEGEEVSANICVLWFKPEPVHIGGDLNLFGPRVLSGAGVCEFNDCHVGRVVPNMANVERLVAAGFFVVPCTQKSTLPNYAPRTTVLWQAFEQFLYETQQQIKEPLGCGTSTVVEQNLKYSSLPSAADASDHDKLYSSILSSHLGHPCATIGRAYAVLQEHAAKESIEASAFHGLVSAGLAKFGESFAMEALMKVCTDLISSGNDDVKSHRDSSTVPVRRESPNKRVKETHPAEVPSVDTVHSPPSVENAIPDVQAHDPLIAHLRNKRGWRHILGLAGMNCVAFPDGSQSVPYDLPIDENEVVETAWVLLGFSDIQNPDQDTFDLLKNRTNEVLTQTFNADTTTRFALREFTFLQCAAIAACLEKKPIGNKECKDFNETIFVVSHEDNSKNELYRFRCCANGGRRTVDKCNVSDLLSTTHLETHQRNLLRISVDRSGNSLKVECFSD